MSDIVKIPTMDELVKTTSIEENKLVVLLNQEPHKPWVKEHPLIKNKVNGVNVPYKYVPRERIEYMLTRIFTKWWIEIKEVKIIANSVVTTVRLYVKNPVTGEVDWQDGVGASPIQTKQGFGATDFANMTTAAIQMAAPSSKTYAFKDAAESFGKLFGKDLNVDPIEYDSLLKAIIEIDDLKALFELKKEFIPSNKYADIERVIDNEEKASYQKVHTILKNL